MEVLRSLLRNLFRRTRVEQTLDDEIQASLAILIRQHIEAGVSPREARREALLELGGVEQVKEEVRQVRRGVFVESLWQDLRHAGRAMRQAPGFTAVVVLTLGLGIGATTAIYAVFNFVLFRPVPGIPSEVPLITVHFEPLDRTAMAFGRPSALQAMRDAASSLEGLAHASRGTLAVAAPLGSQPTFEEGEFVTGQFFRTLGVRPRIGRFLTDEEADAGSQNLVVVSDRFWRMRLGAKADAVGQAIAVNGHPFVVVGVTDRYRGWGNTRVGETDLWLPIGASRAVTGDAVTSMSTLVGRVRRNTPLNVIEQQLRSGYEPTRVTLSQRNRQFFPFVYTGLHDFSAAGARTSGLRLYWLLMAAVVLLLLLSCANAANLLLARAGRRERDTAVRLAIGGSRRRIVRQFLVESLGLATLACATGLLVAMVLTTSLGGMRLLDWFPDLRDIEMDSRVLLFCGLVTSATVLAFGILPAVIASRTDIHGVLGRGGRTAAAPHRLRHALIVVQIALSFTLVTGAGVLNRSLQHLFTTDLGMDLDHVIGLSLKPYYIGYNDDRSARIIDGTIAGLRRVGFHEVAFSSPEPLTSDGARILVRTDAMSEAQARTPVVSSVSPDFFRIVRVPLLSGRTFTESEYHESESVSPMPVILNATMASDLFGSAPAVGRTFGLDRLIGMESLSTVAVVVGVVGDTRASTVRSAPRAALYHARQSTWRFGSILVRTDEAAGIAIQRIRGVVHEIDSALPITSLRPLRDDVAESLSEDRVLARLSALVAFLAALLASSGVFSIISQLVTERTRDFGIRTALGASSRDILGLVLRGVVGRSALAVAIGFCLYWGTSRWLETRVFGLSPLDPATVATAMVVLVTIAIGAALVPARAATRVDPVIALRAD